jgi:hypothetical protein
MDFGLPRFATLFCLGFLVYFGGRPILQLVDFPYFPAGVEVALKGGCLGLLLQQWFFRSLFAQFLLYLY